MTILPSEAADQPEDDTPARTRGRDDSRPLALALGVLIAYAGAVFIPFYLHWYQVGIFGSDYGSQGTANALVPLALAMTFALVAFINPLLRKVLPPAGLGRRELLIVFSLWALTCVISFKDLGLRTLCTAGVTMGRGVTDKAITKVNFREDFLPRKSIFVPDDPERGVNASTQYYFGLSPDNETHIKAFAGSPLLQPDELIGLAGLAGKLTAPDTPLSTHLAQQLRAETRRQLADIERRAATIAAPLLGGLNAVIQGDAIHTDARFAGVDIGEELKRMLATRPTGTERTRVNRMLIERAYPQMLVRRGAEGPVRFTPDDIRNAPRLAQRLFGAQDPVSRFVRDALPEPAAETLASYAQEASHTARALADELNAVLTSGPLYTKERFADAPVSNDTVARARTGGEGTDVVSLNRTLVEEVYRDEIAARPPAVPWGAWFRPLLFWGALILVFVAFSSSLVRAVHRQWSRHELLAYPIAGAMDSVVGIKRGRLWPELFYSRVFWFGFGMMGVLFTINGLQRWFQQSIKIPLNYTYYDLIKEFTFLSKYCGREAYSFFRGVLYPFMAAIAVLLPTEVSLTCWLGYALMIFGTGFYFLFTGEVITAHETGHIQSGMHVALAIVVLVIGRREYVNVLRCALFVHRPEDEMQRRAAGAARVFVGCFFLLAALFMYAGLDWFQALVLTGSFGLMVLLIARVTAEAGVPWLVNFSGNAIALPFQVLGAATLGPTGIAVIHTVGGSLHDFTSNSIAAQETTISKLREPGKGWFNGGGFTLVLAVGILLALTATVFFQLWDNYSFGARKQAHAVNWLKSDMSTAAKSISRLDVEVGLDDVKEGGGLARVSKYWQFDGIYWRFFALGAAAVFVCAFLRLHLAWWPFHPLPLLFINSWAMSRMAYPTLVGWLIKTAILRIWGGKAYTRAKPFFYGIIVGQVVMTMFWALVAALYHILTGMTPERLFTF